MGHHDRTEQVKGYMTVVVAEASGRNRSNEYTWDGDDFHGFMQVEVRGGPCHVKAQTFAVKAYGGTLAWNESLVLEVLEGASELRLLLCQQTTLGIMTAAPVVAACGIHMKDIMDAVPFDKYFELFRPGEGGDSVGFIRVGISYSQGPFPFPCIAGGSAGIGSSISNVSTHTAHDFAKTLAQLEQEENDDSVDDGPPKKSLVFAGLGAAAALVAGRVLLAKKR